MQYYTIFFNYANVLLFRLILNYAYMVHIRNLLFMFVVKNDMKTKIMLCNDESLIASYGFIIPFQPNNYLTKDGINYIVELIDFNLDTNTLNVFVEIDD